MSLTLTPEAMEAMTFAQKFALLRLHNQRVADIRVQKGGFDLPNGYLAFGQRYLEGAIIYGGIAPNGDVST